MAAAATKMVKNELISHSDDDDTEENFSEDGDWGDWEAGVEEDGDGDGSESDFLCLFCESHFVSCALLFEHCRVSHAFDFHGVRKELKLDFYSSFKLINFVRSQVSCFLCSMLCKVFVFFDKVGSFMCFLCSLLCKVFVFFFIKLVPFDETRWLRTKLLMSKM